MKRAERAYRDLDLDTTISAYRAALAKGENDYQAHVGLARVYTRMRRVEQAEEHAQKALELEPEGWEGHDALGVLLFLTDEIDDARRSLEKAAELAPNAPEPLLTLSQVAADEGGFEEASQHLAKARALIETKDDADRRRELLAMAWHNETYIKLSEGDREGALAAAEKVIALQDANPYAACLAHSNIGILEARARNYDEAIDHLSQACEMNPYFYRASSALGRILIVRGRHEEAVTALEHALSQERNPNTRYAYAVALAKSGQREEALANYRQALEEGLGGVDAIIARLQTLWLSKRARQVLVGIALLALVAWVIFGDPSAQVITFIIVVAAVVLLQQVIGKRL